MVNQQAQVGYMLKQAQSLLRLRMEEALRPLDLTVSGGSPASRQPRSLETPSSHASR
jgi:hypothetical protein